MAASYVFRHRALVGGEGPLVVAVRPGRFAGEDAYAPRTARLVLPPPAGPGEQPAAPTSVTLPRDQVSMRSWVIESK
ncbi:hypothetical protein [Streptomyces griseofuscus]|uniref:hypothetical protein n=1 Tax=Streptomyces griseofuscus TaxID=146922 RepID=UPI0037FB9666